MKHIYFLFFTTMFLTGGVTMPAKTKKMQDHIPQTVFVPWPEKNTARLEGYCNG